MLLICHHGCHSPISAWALSFCGAREGARLTHPEEGEALSKQNVGCGALTPAPPPASQSSAKSLEGDLSFLTHKCKTILELMLKIKVKLFMGDTDHYGRAKFSHWPGPFLQGERGSRIKGVPPLRTQAHC